MINWSLTQTVAPASEPVTLTEAKTHLRVDYSDDDTYITSLIAVARQHVESLLNRSLINQTWQLKLDRFPYALNALNLPRPDVSSITSVTYLNPEDGSSDTWDSTDYTSDAERLYPAYGETYPSVRPILNCVTVTYVAGYGATASSVPDWAKHAIKLIIGEFYERREDSLPVSIMTIPRGVQRLLAPHRVKWLGVEGEDATGYTGRPYVS